MVEQGRGEAPKPYLGEHLTQFDGGPLAKQNCGPTSAAMAADQSTGGRVRRTGSEVRALVDHDEETDPKTPGLSLADLRLAMRRLGVAFTSGNGKTWDKLAQLHAEGHGIVLSGDSDQFTRGCSGTFDGDHCIYVPAGDPVSGEWRIGDPICRDWTTESPATIRNYAEKFGRKVFGRTSPQKIVFGFTARVPLETEDEMRLTITAIKGEDWRAVNGDGVLRDQPDRANGTIVERVPDGTIVRTVAEAETSDGNRWRVTERGRSVRWLLRSDWEPVVQGGDPAIDGILAAYIARGGQP